MPDDMDPSVAARVVCDHCNIWGMKDQHEVMKMIVRESKEAGMSIEEYASHMIDQWKAYKKVITELTYSYNTAAKFFQSALWADADLWPYRLKQPGVYISLPSQNEPAALPEDNLKDALCYWGKMKEMNHPCFRDCPGDIRIMLEKPN